jgi:hypothetical protein
MAQMYVLICACFAVRLRNYNAAVLDLLPVLPAEYVTITDWFVLPEKRPYHGRVSPWRMD